MAAVTNDPMAPFRGGRLLRAAVPLTLVAAAATGAAIALEPRRALLGYLAAYTAVAAVAIGALVLLLIGYATNARWLAPLRRLQEAIAGVFPVLVVLFVPIAVGLDHIYVWADPPPDLPAHERHLLEAKRAWLDPAAFVIRSAICLAVLTVAAEVPRRWSRRRDGAAVRPAAAAAAEAALRRERVFAGAMLPPVGLALTFASFDWLMSLQPAWSSSMFGVYFFTGGFAAAIALLAVLARYLHASTSASPSSASTADRAILTGHHFHALGRMLLGFVVLWAYAAYFQGFLIQIANRPSEVTFFVVRTDGGWGVWLAATVAARFAIPFLLLLPRPPKYRPRYVAAVAALVLIGHVLDLYWLVLPAAGGPVAVHWADAASLVAIAGACVAFGAWRLRGAPLVAAGDPFLHPGTRYESPT
jgi:hypothetical protein